METGKRTRSRTGCLTCRSRKVRCDERHPACGACLRLRLTCSFLPSGQPIANRKRSNQPRQTCYRVRFVEARNSNRRSRSPNSQHTATDTGAADTGATPPEETPSSFSLPSPLHSPESSLNESPFTSPSRSTPPDVFNGTAPTFSAGHSNRLEWSMGGPEFDMSSSCNAPQTQPMPSNAPCLNLDLNNDVLLNSIDSLGPSPLIHDGLGGITDFDGVWDTLPAFDDFMAAFGGAINTSSDNQSMIPQISSETALVMPDPMPAPPFRCSPPPHAPPRTQCCAPQQPLTPPPQTAPSPRPKTMVTIRPEDSEPLQHFLTTMGQFVKLRSSNSDNIYCYIFTNMALAHPPLYEAILAWSSLHMAHVHSQATSSSPSTPSPVSLAADAERRYERASQYLYQDNGDGQAATDHADWTFVTIWFLLQYELFQANGVERFVALLDYAADILEALITRHGPLAIQDQLEPVAMRVLIWLGAYAQRAAPFGGGKALLQCLRRHLSSQDDSFFKCDAKSSEPCPLGRNSSKSDGILGSDQAGHRAASPEMQACLRLALRVNTDRGQCSLLGRWRTSVGNDDEATRAVIMDDWCSVLNSMVTVKHWLNTNHLPAVRSALRVAAGDMNMDRCVVPSSVGALDFNWMQLVAVFNGCVIAYHTNRPSSFPEDQRHKATLKSLESQLPTASESAACILRLTRHATLSRPNSPQCIWPQLLFQAGVETTDTIYQSWAVGILVQAEAWSPNLRRTRHLLERIIQRRRQVQGPWDLVSVMEAEGGKFIL